MANEYQKTGWKHKIGLDLGIASNVTSVATSARPWDSAGMGSNGNLGNHMLRCLAMLLLVTCVCADAWGDDVGEPAAGADSPAFYLEDGDRVVLLGGTIIEREQVYGEWELMLTCLYADADFTVRNLGWSGDTVWADSRGIFDPPEVGYQRMIDQIRELNPTVVILAYGHNEAWAGDAGLDAFITQYEKLIDDIQVATEAETRYLILLPHEQFPMGDQLPDPQPHNDQLLRYVERIQNLALLIQIPTISTFNPVFTEAIYQHRQFIPLLTDDGVQFHNSGYRVTATHLRNQLSDDASPSIVIQNGHLEFGGCDCTGHQLDANSGRHKWVCVLNSLDQPLYTGFFDLSPGQYSLHADDELVETGGESEWNYIQVMAGPDETQREQLRQAIIRKNELYFHRWRPENVTYLFGFRAHEQGNNAVEIPQFDPLIEEQEALIRELKHPVEHVWELGPAE